MQEIVIREAQSEDAEKVIIFTKQIGGESENLSYGSEGLAMSPEQEMYFLNSMKEDAHSVFFTAWQGSELVGTDNLSGLSRRMGHRAELGIAVAKAEWGKGIGSSLMNVIIEYARKNGIEIISLEVRADNTRAIHLYKKFDFKSIGIMPAFFKIGSEYIDFQLMYLDLR